MESETPNPKTFNLFVKLLQGKSITLKFTSSTIHGDDIKLRLFEIAKIPPHHQRLLTGTRLIDDDSLISCAGESTGVFPTVHLLLRLLGGKGGFGSLLRGAATKAGQKKTNNFDACRDMSGRRLRHVNAEKKLEEWKAEEEERKLEKEAEKFLKKKAKERKAGVGDGDAKKYVDKYREVSAQCVAKVEESVREVLMTGVNGKRKGNSMGNGVESKKFKVWMGKRKLGQNDSDEDDSDDEEEVEPILANSSAANPSDSRNEANVSSGLNGYLGKFSDGPSCKSSSGEEKEIIVQGSLESSGCAGGESPNMDRNDAVDPVNQNGIIGQSTAVPCSEVEVASLNDVVQDRKQDCHGTGIENKEDVSHPHNNLGSSDGELNPISANSNANGSVESESSVCEQIDVTTSKLEMENPINFDDFSSAAEMEVLGLERLKSELQARGLKCGGTLQERAARLFLLKSTPLYKLPKKLLAK